MISARLLRTCPHKTMPPYSVAVSTALCVVTLAGIFSTAYAVPVPLDLPASVVAEIDAAHERRSAATSRHECFAAAYNEVAVEGTHGRGCAGLDEDGKMRLAFEFAACQLNATGRSAQPCAADESVKDCGARLTPEGYTEFGAWFRHVDTLCFALESRRWRDDTSRVVQALVTGAGDTVKILGNVLESSEDLRLKNAAALDEALKASALSATLVEQVGTMQHGIAAYAETVQHTISETQSSYASLADVLRQLSLYTSAILSIQGLFARNLIYVQTLFFYAAMGVVAWSLTAPPRTSSARLNLLIGLLVVGAVEVIVLTRWSTLSSLIKASAELHGDGSAAHDFASLEGGASTTGLLPPPPAAVCPTWLPWMPNVLCSAAYSLLDVRWYTSTSAMLLALLWRRIAPSLFGLAASSVGASRTAAFIRLSLDPLSLETWDASTVAWALRYGYMLWAAITLLRVSLSYVDYAPATFLLLERMEKRLQQALPAASGAVMLEDDLDAASDDTAADPDFELPRSLSTAMTAYHAGDGASRVSPSPAFVPLRSRSGYSLRPRRAHTVNPISLIETPDQFMEAVHMRYMASIGERMVSQMQEPEMDDDDDVDMGTPAAVRSMMELDGGDAGDWSDEEDEDEDEDGSDIATGDAAMNVEVGHAAASPVVMMVPFMSPRGRLTGSKRARVPDEGSDGPTVSSKRKVPLTPLRSPIDGTAVPARRRSRGFPSLPVA